MNPETEILWLAAHPANLFLEQNDEKLLPEADQFVDLNSIAESTAGDYEVNLVTYASRAREKWNKNVDIYKRVVHRDKFDLVIGDETYEISSALKKNPRLKAAPFVMIYDFVGFDSMKTSLLEKLKVYMMNRLWSGGFKHGSPPYDLALFVGEPEDVPNKPFGFLLPNRREFAQKRYKFVGYILPFDPANYMDPAKIRMRLGYGKETLIICAIGGTSIGKELLELCGNTFPLIKRKIPNVRMVLVCGPRLDIKSLRIPDGVEIRGYVPRLYEHLASCDLAIVQSGGTSTLELTALRRPFIYFPIEGHFEQEIHVAGRLARHRAGIRMHYSETTPAILAEQAIAAVGRCVNYELIPTNGAQKSAELISLLLG
ncbi:MAG: glycosyltransferase [Candidatus Zixiibacteriota bacterium]